MAQEKTKETLLSTLTNDRLPARRDEQGDVREGQEADRPVEKGRRPEEVVEGRETRPAPKGDGAERPAPQKFKVSIEGADGERVVQELSLDEIIEQGLLEKIITTANQFPNLQKKYQENLEKIAGKQLDKPTEAAPPAAPTPITQEQIRNAYAPVLKTIVEQGYLEPDFAEAYPDVATNLMYYRDRMESAEEKMLYVIEWIKAESSMRDANRVRGLLESTIDILAAKGQGDKPDPLFKALIDPPTRDAFTEWLKTDVDPKVGSLTAANMEKFWFAFNAKEIVNFTRESVDRAKEPKPRPRAGNDGSTTRQGQPETVTAPSLLDRMTNARLDPEA